MTREVETGKSYSLDRTETVSRKNMKGPRDINVLLTSRFSCYRRVQI